MVTDNRHWKKLSPELIKKLAGYIAEGNYLETAANLCGVSDTVFVNWRNQGLVDLQDGMDEENSYCIALLVALKRAESQAEVERVARINAAGIGGALTRRITRIDRDGNEFIDEQFQAPQWLADMTHLERRHPDRWGRRERKQIDITERKEIVVSHVEVVLDKVVESTSRELIE